MKKYYIYIILVIAFLIRIFGLNWDENSHIHPDERFLTMVETSIQLPKSIGEYFDTKMSPLNPYNQGNSFFVYGTFPIFLTKVVGEITNLTGYDQIHFVGRFLSALFDTLIIYFLYLIGKKKLIAPLIYTFLVLPLQLSHFFAVDTFASTFIIACFWALNANIIFLSAIFFGLAMACKISVVYFLPIIFLYLLFKYFKIDKLKIISCLIIFGIFSFAFFRIFQPYAFTGLIKPNPQFINNIKELSAMSKDTSFFPPSVQWHSKTPILFPLQNIVLWGIGLPFSLLFLFLLIKNYKKIFQWPLEIKLSLIWILFLIAYQGSQFVHAMRYFISIYPFFSLIIGYFIVKNKKYLKLFNFCFILNLIWAISFLSIYSRPNTRVEASDWIYKNIPSGSVMTFEAWDDPLPLHRPPNTPSRYDEDSLGLFGSENQEKWDKINSTLNRSGYMIMSSNRLWASIPKVPKQFPETTKYYQDIFENRTVWKPTVKITSYPGFNLPFIKKCLYLGYTDYPISNNSFFEIDKNCLHPGIYFRDDIADETFTVYDHAQVIIFSRRSTLR